MPYKLIAPGIKLWVGEMTPAQELESITRASGLRLFPSANYRSKVIEANRNKTSGAEGDLEGGCHAIR